MPVLRKSERLIKAELLTQRSFLLNEESSMTRWIAAAMLALSLMFGSAAVHPAVATSIQPAARTSEAAKVANVGARRRSRHHYRYAYRPYYYDRPYYYAPAPFFPFFGLGFGPLW
jgi:hypothetical protein